MLAIQLHFTKFKLLNLFLIFKFNRLHAGCLMPKCFIPLPLLGDLPHSGHTTEITGSTSALSNSKFRPQKQCTRNHLGWKGPLRSPSLTVNLMLCPLRLKMPI